MAVLSLEPQCEYSTDNFPLLMEHSKSHCSESHDRHEHVIDITRGGTASSSNSQRDENNGSNGLHHEVVPSIIVQAPTIQSSSSAPNSRNSTFTRRGNHYGQRNRSPLNSGLWISIELAVNVSQIIVAVIVLSLSRNEHPQTPLFAWIVGYTAGCVATLPHLYWRYTRLNNQGSDQESAAHTQSNSSNNNPDSSYISVSVTRALEESGSATSQNGQESGNARRFNSLVEHFKMALDCFFAVWFVVGNVWIFGGHSSASSAPNLYRLCIVFLTFSCIGYAMPFILCATICCCLPCIISILGLREDISQNRGAAPELINALPIYKFKAKRSQIRENSEADPDNLGEGGIFAAGTEKERNVSAEDAVCCICLAKYLDNEELRELPCSHFFHTDCVDKWLKINASCPLCKYGVEDVTTSISRRSSFLRG